MKKIISLLRAIINSNTIVNELNFVKVPALINEIEQLKVTNGKLLNAINIINLEPQILLDIQKAEFKIFSQFGDDGIINFLINYLDIKEKIFIEFGVENYKECNTRFLLINDNWKGLVIDGSAANIKSIQREYIYWRYDLTAVNSFITAENINNIFLENSFEGEIGLLHIDIDGNDYWVWKAIHVVSPIVVILEYNSVFGVDQAWTVPYNPEFNRTKAHYSNLYFGTSLKSACDLAEEKGYDFIGCNSNGNNAYFVRKDKMKNLKIRELPEGYMLSKFRESRNIEGELTFIAGEKRLEVLKGLQVYNTRSGKIETI